MFGHPISQSVPHIYPSALPFSPSRPPLLQHWDKSYPNTLVIRAGRLEKWPTILHILQGHSNFITSVAISPDGTCIASGSYDKTIRLWDAASGTSIGEPLQGHYRSVRSVAFSPDGTRIASGSDDNTVQLWDAASDTAIGGPVQGPSHPVRSVAFSPDSTRIGSGADDKAIRLWEGMHPPSPHGPGWTGETFINAVEAEAALFGDQFAFVLRSDIMALIPSRITKRMNHRDTKVQVQAFRELFIYLDTNRCPILLHQLIEAYFDDRTLLGHLSQSSTITVILDH